MRIILSVLAFGIFFYASGQDSLLIHEIYPSGISIKYGIGSYSVKDEYISREKYSGNLPYFSLGWVRKHEKYVYQLEMVYRNSDEIENNNVSTDLTQFTINQAFLYQLRKKTLFNKDLYMWLGPSTELFVYGNDQNIAVDGFDYAQSYAVLLSLGVSWDAIYPLSDKFQLESSLSSTALSLGLHIVDNEEDDDSAAKPLTLFSGVNASFDLGCRYHISKRISAKAAYRFELMRMSAWDPLLSASDNLVIGLTYGFGKK